MSKVIRAAANGKLKQLEKLVNEHPESINVVNQKGQTPLSVAIESQAIEVINYLLQREDIDVNAGCHGNSPLITCINLGEERLAINLLRKNGNYNTKGVNGVALIQHAIIKQYTSLLRTILRNPQTNINVKMPDSGDTIFHLLVQTGESR